MYIFFYLYLYCIKLIFAILAEDSQGRNVENEDAEDRDATILMLLSRSWIQ